MCIKCDVILCDEFIIREHQMWCSSPPSIDLTPLPLCIGRELSAEQILDASDKMFNAMGNTPEMVQQAKVIARATSSLVHGIKLEAESQSDGDTQNKLLSAAKQLADATARMVEAAKAAAMNPNDEQCQIALQQVDTLVPQIKHTLLSNL